MANSTFWKPNKKIQPPAGGNGSNVLLKNSKNNSKKKPFLKRIGKVGTIVLSVLAVFFMIAFIFVIRPALALSGNIKALRADTVDLQTAMAQRDIIALEKSLNDTERDLKELRVARDKNFGWTRKFGPTKEYYSDSEHFINAGLYGIDAAREVVVLITPFADAAGSEDLRRAAGSGDGSGGGICFLDLHYASDR
jgi:hypothetical protein